MQRVSTRDKIDRSILCPLLESRLFSSMEYSRVSVQASSIVVLLCSNMVRRTGYNQRSFCSPKWTIFCPRASRFCLLVDKRYPSRFDHSSIHSFSTLPIFRAGLESIVGSLERRMPRMLLDLPRKKRNVPPTPHHFHLDFLHLRFREFDTFDTWVKSRHDLRSIGYTSNT